MVNKELLSRPNHKVTFAVELIPVIEFSNYWYKTWCKKMAL